MIVDKKTGKCLGSCKESPSLTGGGRIVIHHHKGTCHHISNNYSCKWCDIRAKILVAFLDEDDGGYDDEIVYFYRRFEEQTKLSRAELKTAMSELRDEGLVLWVKGLVSEWGAGYYGSGFMLTSRGQNEARRLYELE